MGKIRLSRTNEYVNGFREYGIYIDDVKAGVIRNGETRDFEVAPGTHTIYAKIDWCYSPTRPFYISGNEVMPFNVGSFIGSEMLRKYSRWIGPIFLGLLVLHLILRATIHFDDLLLYLFPLTLPLFFIMVYYFSIGRKRYLSLKEATLQPAA